MNLWKREEVSDITSDPPAATGGYGLSEDERAELALPGLIELIGRPPAAPVPEPAGHG